MNLLGKRKASDSEFEKKKIESERMRTKYPDRIPVRVLRSPQCKKIPLVDKEKFLVPEDLTVSQLIFIIRKRVKLAPEMALFLMVGKEGKTIPASSQIMSSLYNDFKDADGFLYVTYTGESTFG